jgi:hypothetical protein
MRRQQALPLDGVPPQDALWLRVSEEGRSNVVEILTRLLARAIHGETGKEGSHDNDED